MLEAEVTGGRKESSGTLQDGDRIGHQQSVVYIYIYYVYPMYIYIYTNTYRYTTYIYTQTHTRTLSQKAKWNGGGSHITTVSDVC